MGLLNKFRNKKGTEHSDQSSRIFDNVKTTKLSTHTTEIKEDVKKADIQHPYVVAELRAMNNKLVFVIIFLMLVSLVAILFSWNRANKVDNSRELLYVQMWGDGSYRVLESLPEDDPVTNATLIDGLLDKYIKCRFGLIPQTAQTDLGDAVLFMTEPVYQYFIDKNGFNVGQIVSDITYKSNIIEIHWRGTPDHYDIIEGKYKGKKIDVLRSNIYITRIEKDYLGNPIKTDYLIAKLQWFLLDKKDVQKEFSQNELRVNPVGMKILSEELIVDNVHQKNK